MTALESPTTDTPVVGKRTRFHRRPSPETASGLVSDLERQQPGVRYALRTVQGLVLVALIVSGAGPLLWLVKSSISSSADIVTRPMSLLPTDGFQFSNITEAWTRAQVGRYLLNTAVMAMGSLLVTLIVCLTTAYVLSALRPKWGPVLDGAIMITLFVPGVIALVPLYLTVVDMPILHTSLLGNYLAIWLPAGANAFIILVVKRFFDALPRELFEAARVDGAGSLQIFVSVVLPMSRPIIGVISLLSVIASWKDFLWPMLVLNPEQQPISVGLANVAKNSPINVQVASLLLAVLVPVFLFLIFQRHFLNAAGLAGGVKG
ncbi:multiple sugar transport system permease protein [Nakamurella sp. UYEF19]|uniref:carbohydrate ABC transporter permease n=1 Tax=Nakamurella sp. UYEF19 TaxID=1756392 RepID=UPI003391A5E6